MGIIDTIYNKFWGRGGKAEAYYLGTLAAEMQYKLLAFETVISFIANTLRACEIKTFVNGEEVRQENHHILNVKPNRNQNASVFWNELISTLYRENEALVVTPTLKDKDNHYVASSFNVDPKVIYDSVYSDITIGTYNIHGTRDASDVWHFKLHNRDLSGLLNSVYEDYGKLLTAATGNYKRKNTPRLIVDVDASFLPDDAKQAAQREFLAKGFKQFFEADGAGVIQPLYKGMELNKSFNPFSSNAIHNTRDVRAMIDDVFDMFAMACHVPSKLIRGDMVNVDNLADLYIMGGLRPLARILEDEINAKQYTRQEYLNRTYIKIDTSLVSASEISKLANAADKLFAIGVNTINDNLRMLGREKVTDPEADKRYITLNYKNDNLTGGENNESANENKKAVQFIG